MPLDDEIYKGKTIKEIGSGRDWVWIKFTDGSVLEIKPKPSELYYRTNEK